MEFLSLRMLPRALDPGSEGRCLVLLEILEYFHSMATR